MTLRRFASPSLLSPKIHTEEAPLDPEITAKHSQVLTLLDVLFSKCLSNVGEVSGMLFWYTALITAWIKGNESLTVQSSSHHLNLPVFPSGTQIQILALPH